MILYHYTTEEGMKGITDSGYIKQSTNTVTDAMLGMGVYLTTKSPDRHTKRQIAMNNYGE